MNNMNVLNTDLSSTTRTRSMDAVCPHGCTVMTQVCAT